MTECDISLRPGLALRALAGVVWGEVNVSVCGRERYWRGRAVATYLGAPAGLEERGDADEAGIVVPHHGVLFLGHIVRHDEGVLEDCSGQWLDGALPSYIIARLTIETFPPSLPEELLLLTRVRDPSYEIRDEAVLLAAGWVDSEASVLLDKLVTHVGRETDGVFDRLVGRVVDLASGFAFDEDRGIFDQLGAFGRGGDV